MVGFVYIIRNTVNNKVYIGQTRVSVEVRWREHLRHARYGDQVINRAMKKYGVDKFYIETLEICDLTILDEREIYYISLYDSTNKSKGYSVSIGGNTPRFKRPVLSISTLVDLYCNEMFTLQQIADRFGVSMYIIKTELTNAGVEVGKRQVIHSKKRRIPKGDLLKALQENTSLRGAAKSLGIPYSTFRAALIYNNIEYNSSKSARQYNTENVC